VSATALTLVRDAVFAEHDWPGHPESARRLEAVDRRLRGDEEISALPSLLSEDIDLDLVRAVHHDSLLQRVEHCARDGGGWLDGDTYCTERSFAVARRAAGAAVEAARLVADGTSRHGYALVRPPGHHATPTRPMGFCLFNNVAVAARWLQRERGLERIAILDIDVHHGNGTQDVFYDDAGVLYVSLHQWPNYPGTGRVAERGEGAGVGATLNLPVPPGTGGAAWLELLDEMALPAVRAHRPEAILVSAGFDAHKDDPLADLRLTTDTYAAVADRVVQLAIDTGAAGTVWVLEGGYDLEALPDSVAATVGVLMADEVAARSER
jgi:acetoin utilization deacetylase AcuC-like enzyme